MHKGFTLIELILYIALLTIFIGGAIQFGWNIILGREKAQVQLEVNQNLRLAMKRIELEIKDASAINNLTSNSISLANNNSNRNPTVIDLTNGRLRIGRGTTGSCPVSNPCYLSSNQVNISSLIFSNFSSGLSTNVRFQMTINHINQGNRQEWSYSQSATSAAEIRSI